MKLLYAITLAEQGGAQVHVADLLRGFRDKYDLALAVGEEGYLTNTARELDVPVHVLPHLVRPIRPWTDTLAIREMYSLIRALKPALVHAHTSKAGIVGRIAARMAGVPSVFTAHTWAFAEGVSWRRKLVGMPSEWLVCRLSESVIAVSEANRQLGLCHGIVPAGKLVVVHNGVPDVSLRAKPAKSATPRIVMVARFNEQKDQHLLVEALAGISRPFELILVGDGPVRPAVEEEVRRLHLADRVEFLGTRDDVAEILADASLFVLASLWEGFPLSILEAMRAGLPVVASRVGGVAEAVQDGETGYLVRAGELIDLREKITLLLDQPELRARMGRAGRDRYSANFTLDGMLTKTDAVYTSAAGVRPGRPS